MYGLFEFIAVLLSDQERWYFDRLALTIVAHSCVLLLVIINYNRHYAAKFLNILNFFHKMAIAAVDHNDMLVAVGGSLFEMRAIELTLIKLLTTILI